MNRSCRRRDDPAADPARPSRPFNAGRRLLVRILAAALAGTAAGGCSLSIPVSDVGVDAAPTGSIDSTAALLAPGLDGEDLRRARAAMAVALDPQGNGAQAAWHNPQTGARGAFAALRPPYPQDDRVCRAFTGEVAPVGAARREFRGAACRGGDGTWFVLRDGSGAT